MNRIFSRPASHLRHIRRTISIRREAKRTTLADDQPRLIDALWRNQILDPNGDIINWWNHIFLFSSLVSLFIDPLYFYLTYVGGPACMSTDTNTSVFITYVRSILDLFYFFHMIMKFRTAYVDPNSKVFGRGELVKDARDIARHYLKSMFIVDLAAALPVPQVYINFLHLKNVSAKSPDVFNGYSVAIKYFLSNTNTPEKGLKKELILSEICFSSSGAHILLSGSRVNALNSFILSSSHVRMAFSLFIDMSCGDFLLFQSAALVYYQIVVWLIIPAMKDNGSGQANNTLALILLFQYIPRLYLIVPLNNKIIKTTGFIAKTAWAGAAYNLLLYMLASHVIGATWYLASIGRQHSCWKQQCDVEERGGLSCKYIFLDCSSLGLSDREDWLIVTEVLTKCDARKDDSDFKFGMFADAFTSQVASSEFTDKYLYCLWWGLRNLSSFGQNLPTSIYLGETTFCIVLCIGGLVLFARLIGQMQTYLQSMTVRLEEWRIRKRDTEEWMRHRQLPPELRERVRRFVQYKWLATRGVNEESILLSLPLDLRREIQQHLCLNLVRRVPFFSQMDDQLLNAICERLVSSLNTEGTYIVREGDPVSEMLFIIRGQLESSTTNGGRTGFYNSITLRPGDFCGEELLTWALIPNSTINLPSSTRSVRTVTEVEAFALRAEDLKFVAVQFKRLHSKKLQHAFRYYSHQWRTWGSCFIQAAWRRYKKKRLVKELTLQESLCYRQIPGMDDNFMYEQVDDDLNGENWGNSSTESANNAQHLGATILASKFAANTRRGMIQKTQVAETYSSSLKMPQLFKPDEPDFSLDSE